MIFESPEWFFLLAVLLFAGVFWPRLQLWRPLRVIALLALVLLLTDPQHEKNQNSVDLWVILDRSDSTEDLVAKGLPEWQELLRRSKPSRKDQLFFIDYAAEVLEQGRGDSSVFSGNRTLTRTNLAIQNALALSDSDRPTRILVFTDGYATEPLVEAAAKLKARGIPLDFRLIREETNDDFSIARITTPVRAQVGEPFVLGITVRGFEDLILPLRIFRDGHPISENTEVSIVDGVGKVEFTDRISRVGSYNYSAKILPAKDAHPGNNKANRWIEITGGPRILLISKYTDDPVAAVLRKQGFTVEVVSDSLSLRVGQLSGTRAVILNNVPAFEMPGDFLNALEFFVKEQGGGLMMAGGKQSFGSGGYFESAVDPLLPVSMELKSEHRKLAVAMAIVMDRSGSMGMTVPAGGKNATKMQLANTGASKAIELLGAQDKITLFAVDSEPHEIIPLREIGNSKKKLMNLARKVKSTGGGIYVYRGLKAAWDELKKADSGTRHIILFSDARDSEQPGAYKALLKEITANSGSVSVIGLGTRSDPDAALLEEIAKLGNGRIFFTNKPVDIPKLFAQETVTVARSAFIRDPVHTKATGHWAEISPKPFEFPPQVDGYNLSYPKDRNTTTSLVANDEYLGPLVAHASRGIGRSVAVSFPLGGEHSEKIRAWKQYGDFVQTLGRWLMGFELPPGLGLKHRLEGTRLTVDLVYDTGEWTQRFAKDPPRIKLVEGEGGGTPYEIAWKRVAPGHFSVTRELEEGLVIRGAVQAGHHALAFGPVVVGSSAEWSFDPERLAELREVSRLSGGRELIDLSTAWIRPPAIHSTNLRLPLLIATFLLILFDALITRMGWRIPILVPAAGSARAVRRQARKKQRLSKRKSNAPDLGPEPAKPTSDDPQPNTPTQPQLPANNLLTPEEEQGERTSRFDRAKRKR